MPSNVNYVVAENVLGFIGTVFWSFQLLPQVWKNFKAKSTHGLSSLMMYSWALSAISYLPYTIVAGLAIPLIIQPILFGVIALCCHAQCKFYDSGWSRFGCIVWFAVNVLIMAAVAAICVVVIQTFATPFNIIWPLNTLGALAVAFLLLGFLPQFYEIYSLKQVLGISLGFMAMDISGGVFSTISLVFRPTFDVLAASSYLVVVACDVTIVLLHFVLKKRHAHVIEEILVIEAHEAGEAIPVHELTTSEELLFSDHPHST